jgi:CHASE2 domain-containing sensor protein
MKMWDRIKGAGMLALVFAGGVLGCIAHILVAGGEPSEELMILATMTIPCVWVASFIIFAAEYKPPVRAALALALKSFLGVKVKKSKV